MGKWYVEMDVRFRAFDVEADSEEEALELFLDDREQHFEKVVRSIIEWEDV